MRRMNLAACTAIAAVVVTGFTVPGWAQGVTVYEGARLIVGDGRVICALSGGAARRWATP